MSTEQNLEQVIGQLKDYAVRLNNYNEFYTILQTENLFPNIPLKIGESFVNEREGYDRVKYYLGKARARDTGRTNNTFGKELPVEIDSLDSLVGGKSIGDDEKIVAYTKPQCLSVQEDPVKLYSKISSNKGTNSIATRYHEQEEFSDVVFHVGKDSEKFHLHRIFMAEYPYFRQQFIINGKDQYLPDANVDIFKKIVQYIYTGSCCVDEKDMKEFKKHCKLFEIGLSPLRVTITEPENSIYSISMINERDFDSLTDKLEKISIDNVKCAIIYTWVKGDIENRKKHLVELLKTIDWKCVSSPCKAELFYAGLLPKEIQSRILAGK